MPTIVFVSTLHPVVRKRAFTSFFSFFCRCGTSHQPLLALNSVLLQLVQEPVNQLPVVTSFLAFLTPFGSFCRELLRHRGDRHCNCLAHLLPRFTRRRRVTHVPPRGEHPLSPRCLNHQRADLCGLSLADLPTSSLSSSLSALSFWGAGLRSGTSCLVAVLVLLGPFPFFTGAPWLPLFTGRSTSALTRRSLITVVVRCLVHRCTGVSRSRS